MTKWKKFMAVSCSHGHLADAKATKAALEFKKRFKPDTTLHLGDAIDLAALRAGAMRKKIMRLPTKSPRRLAA